MVTRSNSRKAPESSFVNTSSCMFICSSEVGRPAVFPRALLAFAPEFGLPEPLLLPLCSTGVLGQAPRRVLERDIHQAASSALDLRASANTICPAGQGLSSAEYTLTSSLKRTFPVLTERPDDGHALLGLQGPRLDVRRGSTRVVSDAEAAGVGETLGAEADLPVSVVYAHHLTERHAGRGGANGRPARSCGGGRIDGGQGANYRTGGRLVCPFPNCRRRKPSLRWRPSSRPSGSRGLGIDTRRALGLTVLLLTLGTAVFIVWRMPAKRY